jgi:hypothetical protein
MHRGSFELTYNQPNLQLSRDHYTVISANPDRAGAYFPAHFP